MADSRTTVDLLIRNAHIVSFDNNWSEWKDGAVAVAGSTVVAVGDTDTVIERFQTNHTIDAKGHALLPGLINAHTHAAMTMFRGLADDLPLETWLNHYIWPAEAWAVNPEMVYWGTLLASVEMLLGGTTLFCDMYFYSDQVGEAAKKAGIRAVLGEALVDFESPHAKSSAEGLAYTEQCVKRWKNDPLIIAGVQPHSPYSASAELLIASKELSTRYQVPFLTHAAETASEVRDLEKKTKLTPIRYLDSLGVLDEHTMLAHAVHVSDDEIELIAEKESSVVHCPQSNQKLASGSAPVPKMLKKGVEVALGTDGAASNNNLDLWGEIQSAALMHKMISGDPTAATAREMLWAATRGGAAALGLGDQIGSIQVGLQADLILVDLRQPHLIPLYDIYSHLAYAVRSSDVDTVMVNGEIVVSDGTVLGVDLDELYAKVNETAESIGSRFNS